MCQPRLRRPASATASFGCAPTTPPPTAGMGSQGEAGVNAGAGIAMGGHRLHSGGEEESPMANTYDQLDDKLTAFIRAQKLFFVATAPLDPGGCVNVSPKGYDSL